MIAEKRRLVGFTTKNQAGSHSLKTGWTTRILVRWQVWLPRTTVFCILICSFGPTAQGQTNIKLARGRGSAILELVKKDLQKYYYDPTFHGLDLDAHFETAEAKMQNAQSVGQTFGIIAQSLEDFKDSHTRFIPPMRAGQTEYGWEAQGIGEQFYVTAVQPGSDAEAKGVKVGDRLLAIDNYEPTRENFRVLNYLYYVLRPKTGMRLMLQTGAEAIREIDVLARVTERRVSLSGTSVGINRSQWEAFQLRRHRFSKPSKDIIIWKMPRFDLDKGEVDTRMSEVRSQDALILDLRGNPGGLVTTLQRLVGHFFETDIKIGDVVERKKTEPLVAKTTVGNAFKGKIIVLVDSESASASELFARVVQVEERGVVLGDRTSGAVMRSRVHSHTIGADIVFAFAVSVTDADIKMTDGRSLEHTGVVPDELLLPSAADLAARRDPVMTRALEILGHSMTPEEAGGLFPVRWSNE